MQSLLIRHCRVPPRRAGNFLLRAQKKVTKEEGLNTDFYRSLGHARPSGRLGQPAMPEPPCRSGYGSLRIAGGTCTGATRAMRSEQRLSRVGGVMEHLAASGPLGRLHPEQRRKSVLGSLLWLLSFEPQMKVTRPAGAGPGECRQRPNARTAPQPWPRKLRDGSRRPVRAPA